MTILGVSEAQNQFTKILSKSVLIIDKKSQQKRAVILPYAIYEKLALQESKERVFKPDKELEAFIGFLKSEEKEEKEIEVSLV